MGHVVLPRSPGTVRCAKPTAAAPCEYLEWDSAFFGVRIARVTMPRLNPDAMQGVPVWCRVQAVCCGIIGGASRGRALFYYDAVRDSVQQAGPGG
jgi:hypothetical protein